MTALRHDPQFQKQCAEAYSRLGTLALVSEEVDHSIETVRQALINAGVERLPHRGMWSSDTKRIEAHYRRIRQLKDAPKCTRCGIRLDLLDWGSDWPSVNQKQQLCGWCSLEID